MARLGDIGKIVTGNTPKTSESRNYTSNDICFVKPSDIADGIVTCLNDSEFYISEYARAKARILPPKSVLVTCIGIIGKVAINDVECAFNQQINAIIPDNSKCLTEYLAYAIQNKQPEMQDVANAPVVPIMNKTQFSDIEINLPSLTEQEEIVEKLNAVSRLIALRKAQLAKLDQLVKSRFIELFGDLASPECKWRRVKLVDACSDSDNIKCGPFGTQLSKDEYQSEGIAVWEISQINSRFTAIPTHYLSEDKAKQLDAYSIKAGDIAMSRKGNVGKCAVFPSNFEAGIIHSDVLRIRVDDSRVLPLFMMCQLHYSGAVQHQIELVSSGAIMAGINVTKLKQIFVHIPPMELQNQFATFVEQTDKSKFDLKQSLEKLETLKKSLMQQFFG